VSIDTEFSAVHPALSSYNIEFEAPAVGTMNQIEWEFLLCEWSSFRFSALLFRLG